MRLDVFEYLIAIEQFGSLNKAAEHLFLSQPNLTSAIQSFEKEVGYSILNRNHKGVSFTDKGKEVLIIAHNILDEAKKLDHLHSSNTNLFLKISFGNSYTVLNALTSFLKHNSEYKDIQLIIQNQPVMKAMESVYTHDLDLSYIIIPTTQDKLIKEYCRTHSLTASFFQEKHCCITIHKKHPLLKQEFAPSLLWDYPFVDFLNQKDEPYGPYQKFINPSKQILVEHSHLRNIIIKETNAYGIGLEPEIKDTALSYIPLNDLFMHLVEIRRNSDIGNELFEGIRKEIH